MKKITRDKKFGLARETIRELTTPRDLGALRLVAGAGSCELTPSTHGGVVCVPHD